MGPCLGLIVMIVILPLLPAYGQSGDPAVEKAAERFRKEVITPFDQLWERGQRLDALHLYLLSRYIILFHYYLAGEVEESLKKEMGPLLQKVGEAQREYGPRSSHQILQDKILLRTASSPQGIPAVNRVEMLPTVSLPDYPRWGVSRLSPDCRFIIFDEQFSEWSEMEAMGPGLMTLEGKYVYRMIDRAYTKYGAFLWSPAGGMMAWHSDISGYIATLDFTTGTRIYALLGETFDIALSDWSLDGQDILFSDRELLPSEDDRMPQKLKSIIYRWKCGEKSYTQLSEGIDARFSPDKRHIVYVGDSLEKLELYLPGDEFTWGTIFILTLSDKSSYEIGEGMQPIYSPCSDRIAFVSRKGGGYSLLVYDPGSKKTAAEASSRDIIINPAWISKDELIYNLCIPRKSEEGVDYVCDIYWANTSTHKSARLTSDGRSLIDRAWLHTGKEIACLNKIVHLEYR